MANHVEIAFGGLYSRGAPTRTPLDRAIIASDLDVDADILVGRSGYSAVLSAALASTGAIQGCWRFRPDPDHAFSVACIAGTIYCIRDPTSDTDLGEVTTPTGGTSAFGATATVCAVQMGKYLYIGSDEAAVNWKRLSYTPATWPSGFTLGTLDRLPPTQSVTWQNSGAVTMSITLFTSCATAQASSAAAVRTSHRGSSLPAGWNVLEGLTAGVDAAVGEYCQYKTNTGSSWAGMDWLAVILSPHDNDANGDGGVEISVAEDSGGTPGVWHKIGLIYDVKPPVGSPNYLFCDISDLDAATKSSDVKWIRMTIAQGATGAKYHFYFSGFMPVPAAPASVPMLYWASFLNSTTGYESDLSSPECKVTVSASQITTPTFKGLYAQGYGSWAEGATNNVFGSVDRLFNFNVGKTYPLKRDVGILPVIRVTLPSIIAAGHKVRLWREIDGVKRLAVEYTLLAADIATGYVDLTDTSGWALLSEAAWSATGTPPPARSMATRGRRIVVSGAAPNEERLYVSSYLPPASSEDTYPQFPSVPLTDADGWQFDLLNKSEQVQAVLNGDALFFLTPENCYTMPSVAQDTIPDIVLTRGCVGPRAAIYAENMVIWAAYDGIYTAESRSSWHELTEDIRSYYMDTFAPTNEVILAYRDRVLYAWCGTRMLRYSFTTQRWTTGTVATAPSCAMSWCDAPGGLKSQMWTLMSDWKLERWLDSSASDDGTAIPAWVYRTGYEKTPSKAFVDWLMADASGEVQVTLSKGANMANVRRLVISPEFGGDEVEVRGPKDFQGYKFSITLSGARATELRSLMWERSASPARGG